MKENLGTSLKALICKIYKEELEEEDDLEEITTTGDIEGYSTPYAFSDDNEKKKRKMKQANNAVGYKFVNEALENKDINLLKIIIRNEVAAILRDIWLKRTTWK
tara:strand:+ start:442 stop:753 length:312 start_codon:yes stop_codon:yes gene_type:complete